MEKKLPREAGAIQQQLGTVMDLFPTVLSLAGVDNPKGHTIDGVDLRVQFDGKKNATRSEKVLMHFPHEHRGSYFTTYIDGDWKLIYYYNPERSAEPRYRLYNLKNDPGESLDLSLRDGNRVKAMVKAMSAQLEAEGALYPEDAEGHVLKPLF